MGSVLGDNMLKWIQCFERHRVAYRQNLSVYEDRSLCSLERLHVFYPMLTSSTEFVYEARKLTMSPQ